MAATYSGTWIVFSDPPATSAQLAAARKLVGELKEYAGFNDLGVVTRTTRHADGTVISATILNGVPKVTITSSAPSQQQPLNTTQNVWIPRGIVTYPAYKEAPFGYGLPIVQDTTFGPYAAQNLAPGLAVNRWTVGGPCGEVLLSPDKDAGYPQQLRDVTVPLLYDPKLGPVFKWNGDGAYDSRKSDNQWSAYRIEFTAPVASYPGEDVAQSNALFNAINAYRLQHGVTVLNAMPRGHYNPAKVMASIMVTAGVSTETAATYPPGYMTSADRLTKDGYSAEVAYGNFTTWARGDNPTAYELRSSGGAPAGLISAWQSDSASNTMLTADVGRAAFGDVGYRGGFWCADIISRTRWIEAGNCYWQSADADLPPISWHGFASMNLAWETYPAQYDTTHYTTAPLVPLYAFTSTYGDCWLGYPRSTMPTLADTDPAMGRHIYMRGRSIALAPRGGLIWGACLQAVGGVDRMIALVHHPEDQPSDYTNNGWTRYLRVWWCDIPRREHLRADPQETICGEDTTDTWGWKGGQIIDVGHMPPPSTGGTIPVDSTSALKYASQWRFSADGSRAICLRDYGLYTDYSALYDTLGVLSKNGLFPRAVELQFGTSAEATNTTATFHDYAAGAHAAQRPIASPLGVHDTPIAPVYEYPVKPIAVDYGPNGGVVYAFTGDIASNNYAGDIGYTYIGTGPATAAYPSDLGNLVLHGAAQRTEGSDFRPTAGAIAVADVSTGAFVGEGVLPLVDATSGQLTGAPCYPFTASAVLGVRMWRNGSLLDESWYPAPDGAVFTLSTVCDNTFGGSVSFVDLPLATSRNVQTFLAERLGASVFSTQVGPLPQTLRFLNAAPNDTSCGCRVEIHSVISSSHWMAMNELNPRGGRAIANIPMPVSDWLIYAKVV
jgi:hypothetical protein